MSEDVEFLQLHDRPTKGLERKLEDVAYKTETLSGAYMSYGLFSNQSCVEGMLECNEYQQVWRLLGFLIDCNKVLCKMIKESGDSLTEEGYTRYMLWEAMCAGLNCCS